MFACFFDVLVIKMLLYLFCYKRYKSENLTKQCLCLRRFRNKACARSLTMTRRERRDNAQLITLLMNKQVVKTKKLCCFGIRM